MRICDRICYRIFWQKVQIAYFSAYKGIFKIAHAENMPHMLKFAYIAQISAYAIAFFSILFSGEREQSPPQTQFPTLRPPYSKFLDPPLLVRFPTHSMHRLVTYCVVLDFLVLNVRLFRCYIKNAAQTMQFRDNKNK